MMNCVNIYQNENCYKIKKIKNTLNTDYKRYIYPDIIYKNIIIECNGDFYHCNPKFYDSAYINPKTQQTAEYVWNHDNMKHTIYKSQGFKVIVVWESDWINNKQLIIENILHEIQKNTINK